MKRFSKFLSIVVICTSFASLAFGQFGNQHFSNQMMDRQMRMGQMYNYGVYESDFNLKYEYIVMLKDSTTKEVKSKIYTDTTLHKNYVLIINKDFKKSDPNREIKIYADQTLSISRETPSHEIVTGSATDSCWLFKVIEGPIKAYSFLPPNASRFSEYSIVGIQKDAGPILPFKPENLIKMIAPEPKAMEKFKYKEYLKALKTYNKNIAKKIN
ncbi:hypothetical protein EOD41_09335 [Mucilaginibacter limnophilus]|uniref:GLPGLI family protein n=1 Tax=Mucilaginibacter limnophilus TaxID=1932778 RepID=A0A437MTB2_9SPHI|nr:hypothetical protein [Mucilaginibacter limnophilus]RVU00830.1 hypothetical protein EOD41_09335 [Mucilaginibacter limnophilus]